MIADITGRQLVAASVAASALIGGISGEHVQVIILGAGFVGAIVTGFVWLDARIDRKIEKQSKENHALLLATVKQMLAEHRAHDAERRLEAVGQ